MENVPFGSGGEDAVQSMGQPGIHLDISEAPANLNAQERLIYKVGEQRRG